MHIRDNAASRKLLDRLVGVEPEKRTLRSVANRARNQQARAATASLMWQLRRYGIRVLRRHREYKFTDRRWRFDISIPKYMLAIEIQGLHSHQYTGQFISDCEKSSKAFSLGWTVVPILHSMIHDGRAVKMIVAGLAQRKLLDITPNVTGELGV